MVQAVYGAVKFGTEIRRFRLTVLEGDEDLIYG